MGKPKSPFVLCKKIDYNVINMGKGDFYMSIKNEPKIKNPLIVAIREQLASCTLDVNWSFPLRLHAAMISVRFVL